MRTRHAAAAAAPCGRRLPARRARPQDKLKVGFIYVGPVGDFG